MSSTDRLNYAATATTANTTAKPSILKYKHNIRANYIIN